MIIGDMSRKLRAVPLGVPLAVLSAGTGLSLLAGSRQLHSICGIGCLGLSIHRPADGRHQAAAGAGIRQSSGSSGAGAGSRTGGCAAAWAGVCAYPLCQKLERYWQFPEQSGAPAYREQL